MEPVIKTYKRQFDKGLRHIKLILMRQRDSMSAHDWLQLVHETRESILSHPEEYFCSELPPKSLLREAIDKVFEGFLTDQRLLALQKSKAFRIPVKLTRRGPDDQTRRK